jgi:cytochrome c biogenesis protein CcdA
VDRRKCCAYQSTIGSVGMFILLPIALISGILTSLSPCVLPILPIVLASGIDGNVRRVRGMIAGLVVSFTVFALAFSAIVEVLGIPADIIRNIAVVLLVALGISLAWPKIWDTIQTYIERVWKFQPSQSQNKGFLGGFGTGVGLGVVWTPCVGPIVASVATLAALDGLTLSSVLLVFTYALGSGLTLYAIATGGKKLAEKTSFIKQNSVLLRQIFGVIIIATGVFIGLGYERQFQAWALDSLPDAWANLPTQFENRFNRDASMKDGNFPEGFVRGGQKKQVQISRDFRDAKVDQRDLIMGCRVKDCIPSIEYPEFESAKEADVWLASDSRVFGVNLGGIQRAYPQNIMNWHEIVNDELNGRPIAITFCPLCGSAVGFERIVNGNVAEFGVSGFLHENDLIMYDRNEGSLWQQITGEGIVGLAARRNDVLMQIPIITTSWSAWKSEYPDTRVLSRNTGYERDYSRYPYGTYESDETIMFGDKVTDTSLHPKTIVYGVEIGGESRAYPADILTEKRVISDTLAGVNIMISQEVSGEIVIRREDGGQNPIPMRLFWFGWAAFHPDTTIYED